VAWVPGVRTDLRSRDQRVLEAIRGGAQTQKEIKREAKIETQDEVGLALAELMLDRGVVKTKQEGDVRIYFLNPALQEVAVA
jgi:hypothetical protein